MSCSLGKRIHSSPPSRLSCGISFLLCPWQKHRQLLPCQYEEGIERALNAITPISDRAVEVRLNLNVSLHRAHEQISSFLVRRVAELLSLGGSSTLGDSAFMLCERCQEREAAVHVTNIFGDTGEMKKHDFCEACSTDSEGGRVPSPASRGTCDYCDAPAVSISTAFAIRFRAFGMRRRTVGVSSAFRTWQSSTRSPGTSCPT